MKTKEYDLPRWILLILCALWLGCWGEKKPTFETVLADDIHLARTEQQAVSLLLREAELPPAQLEVVEEDSPTSLDWIRIVDGYITEASLRGITSVAPLAQLSSLEKLDLAGTFSHLNDFGRHESLEDLSLSAPQLQSLEGLRGCCPTLNSLEVQFAPLPQAKGLPQFASLQKLTLTRMGLVSAPALEGQSSLTNLDLSNNHLSDLSFLPALPRLVQLDIAHNQLERLDSLPPFPTLVELYGSNNPIQTLSGLPPLDHLEVLDLSHTKIPHLDDLRPLTQLKRLRLGETPVADLEPLLDLPNLQWVEVENTKTTQIPSAFEERRIQVSMSEAMRRQIEYGEMKTALVKAESEQPGTFVLELPGGGGRARGHRGRCTWATGAFKTPQLQCDKHIDSLSGLIDVKLVSIDPANPTLGGGSVHVTAEVSVQQGIIRLYLRQESDPCGLAAALAGGGSPSADPSCQPKVGYRYAEARPGSPASVRGQAFPFGSDLVLWLEAVEGKAQGIDFKVEPNT